jgi:hypothetical protein
MFVGLSFSQAIIKLIWCPGSTFRLLLSISTPFAHVILQLSHGLPDADAEDEPADEDWDWDDPLTPEEWEGLLLLGDETLLLDEPGDEPLLADEAATPEALECRPVNDEVDEFEDDPEERLDDDELDGDEAEELELELSDDRDEGLDALELLANNAELRLEGELALEPDEPKLLADEGELTLDDGELPLECDDPELPLDPDDELGLD